MEFNFDVFMENNFKRLGALCDKYQVKMQRLRYDYGMLYRDEKWIDHITDVDFVGSSLPGRKAECEAFKKDATALFREKTPEVKIYDNCFHFQINPDLRGMKFPNVEEVIPLIGMRSRRKPLCPRHGDYTLVYFWSSKSERSMNYMKLNESMLDKHVDWNGRLRIMDVNTDDDMEMASREIRGKFWERIDHYWATKKGLSGFWSQIPDKAGPYYVLIDKDGYVVMSGDPEWIDLEPNLEKFMDGEVVKETYNDLDDRKRFVKMPVKDPAYKLEQYKKDIKLFTDSHEEDFEHTVYTSFDLSFNKVFMADKAPELYGCFSLRYNWLVKYQAISEKIANDAIKAFSDKVVVRQSQSKKKLYKVEFGEKCDKCGKALGECDQYRCVKCEPPQHFCLDCVKSQENAKKVEELMHPHAFYFIQKGSKDVLDELKIMRVKVCKVQVLEQKHRITCAICGVCETPINWKCANCIQQDFCDKCFMASRDPANPRYKEIAAISKKIHHNPATHIYVREDFSGRLAYYFQPNSPTLPLTTN